MFRNLTIIANKMPRQILDNFMDKFYKINNKLKQEIKNFHFYKHKNQMEIS